jgi:hypothetical protein
MAKFEARAKPSKLSKQNKSEKDEERVTKQGLKEYPRSYKLDPEVMNMLKSTLDRVNAISPKKISETRLVKALFILSTKIEDEKLLKALREVW